MNNGISDSDQQKIGVLCTYLQLDVTLVSIFFAVLIFCGKGTDGVELSSLLLFIGVLFGIIFGFICLEYFDENGYNVKTNGIQLHKIAEALLVVTGLFAVYFLIPVTYQVSLHVNLSF